MKELIIIVFLFIGCAGITYNIDYNGNEVKYSDNPIIIVDYEQSKNNADIYTLKLSTRIPRVNSKAQEMYYKDVVNKFKEDFGYKSWHITYNKQKWVHEFSGRYLLLPVHFHRTRADFHYWSKEYKVQSTGKESLGVIKIIMNSSISSEAE